MRLTSFGAAAVGIVVIVAAACSSDSSNSTHRSAPDGSAEGTDGGTSGGSDGSTAPKTDAGTDSGPTITITQVEASLRPLAEAACGWSFRCCTGDEISYEIGPTGDADDCTERVLASAKQGGYFYDGVVGRVYQVLRNMDRLGYGSSLHSHVDADAVAACAASIEKSECTPARAADHCVASTPIVPGEDPCAVRKILVGDQKVGGVCSYGATDCAPGLDCVYVNGNDGVCVPNAAPGDRCLQDSECGDLLCDFVTGTCVAGKALGEACAYSDPSHPRQGSEKIRCAAGLLCDTVALVCADPQCAGGSSCQADGDCPATLQCIKNQCGKPLAPGEDCYQSTDCAIGTCKYDSSAQRSRCSAPASIGAACDGDLDCASHYCKYDTGTGLCHATVAVGTACPTGQGNECNSGRCVLDPTLGYICGSPAKAGNVCSLDTDCNPTNLLFCVAGACVQTPIADGDACANASQCKSQVCSSGLCQAKGLAGDPCGGSYAPCDKGFYCGAKSTGTGSICIAKKSQGEPCAIDAECWGYCQPNHGELRCSGLGGAHAFCGGNSAEPPLTDSGARD